MQDPLDSAARQPPIDIPDKTTNTTALHHAFSIVSNNPKKEQAAAHAKNDHVPTHPLHLGHSISTVISNNNNNH